MSIIAYVRSLYDNNLFNHILAFKVSGVATFNQI